MASLAEQVAETILQGLRQGEFAVGELLPVSAVLAQRVGCSVATVHRALTDLARAGVVRRIRRKGTILLRVPQLEFPRVCLLQGHDAHANGLLTEPIFTALTEAGCEVDVVPLSANLAMTVERCEQLRDPPQARTILVSLFNPHPQAKEQVRAWQRLGKAYPKRVRFADFPDPKGDPQACWVGIDQPAEVRVAMEHLLQLGHRRIAVAAGIQPNEYSPVRDDAEMCRHIVELFGGTFVPVYFCGDAYRAKLPELFRKHGVTAYWAITDNEALHAVNELHRAGFDVPGDISVMGRNDTPWCSQVTPPLTSISWNPPGVATAVASAAATLAGEAPLPESRVALVKPILVARQSTGPVAG